ncbi:hypothetical protein [Cryobacterium sp. Y57]|uniref:hypothetical protein n=1 Tax=Cryobacterium sp. Y57 TaxID=2048287 RepID=UPI001304C431|nr:hypothetical protein [Cryobacterium sp. Y57]
MRARPGEQEWDVVVVDPDDPMLIFDASNGAIIPARNSLPRDRVVIGVPRIEGQDPEGLLEFDSAGATITRHESPFGWESWSFATVDLTHVNRVRRGEDRWRFVSTSTRPQVTYPATLCGSATVDGLPIFTDLPLVTVPAADAASAQSLAWSISLTEEVTGRVLWKEEVSPKSDPQNIALWPERSAPLLGKYVIVVRGALGRGITRRVSIAEGWKATIEPSFRYLTPEANGMEAGSVTLVSAGETVQIVTLDRSTASAHTTLQDRTGTLEATVRLPHMSIAVSHGESLPVVTLRPQSIDVESLDNTQLRVLVPVGLRATLGLVAAGRVEQTIDGGISSPRGYVNFNLGQFADTGRSVRSALLQLRIGDRSLPVGTLRPRKLADEIHFDAEAHVLNISPGASAGLTAAIYPKYSPWEAPTVVSFATGANSVDLPRAATDVGEATILFRIDDPWSPSPWPAYPHRNDPNLFALPLLPLRDADGSPEVGFARWLAGLGDIPTTSSALPLAAKILSLLGTFECTRPYKKLRSALSALFEAHPALFIDTVMHAPLAPSVLMRLVVDSNLAAKGSEIPPPVPGSWPLNSFLGLIGDYEGTQKDSDPEFIRNLENFAGSTALTVLDTGIDPDARIGRFDDNTRILHTFPEDRLEQIWAAASAIPGRLLQKDTRLIAARQLFDARNSRTLRDLADSSASILTRTTTAIHGVFGPEGVLPVEARIGSDGWRNLPALSMAFAIVARLAARDLGSTRGIFASICGPYAQLAEAAPAFVEQDLVIAELWIMNWRNEWTR